MSDIQTPNGLEANETLVGATDEIEVYQPASGGIRRNKKAFLDTLKTFFQTITGGVLNNIVTFGGSNLMHDSGIAVADIGSNTTHRGSDGKNHSDVVLNNTHRSSDGSDHTFIDQDVKSSAGPTFVDGKTLLTSANYLHLATATHNDVFDKLDPFIPDNGNIMKVTGFIVDFSVSRVERISSTTITFYGVRNSGLFTSTVTDGDTGSTYSAISIAW